MCIVEDETEVDHMKTESAGAGKPPKGPHEKVGAAGDPNPRHREGKGGGTGAVVKETPEAQPAAPVRGPLGKNHLVTVCVRGEKEALTTAIFVKKNVQEGWTTRLLDINRPLRVMDVKCEPLWELEIYSDGEDFQKAWEWINSVDWK